MIHHLTVLALVTGAPPPPTVTVTAVLPSSPPPPPPPPKTKGRYSLLYEEAIASSSSWRLLSFSIPTTYVRSPTDSLSLPASLSPLSPTPKSHQSRVTPLTAANKQPQLQTGRLDLDLVSRDFGLQPRRWLSPLMPPAPDRGTGRPSKSQSQSPTSSNPTGPRAASAAAAATTASNVVAVAPLPAEPSTPSASANNNSNDADVDAAPAASPAPAPAPALSASTSSPSATPQPSPTAQSFRPKFLSRLSSLPLSLRNRNRNVTDFHIRCDEPYKKYTTGEHVRGAVVLAIVKPVRITHLTVALHGFVRVQSSAAAVAKMPANLAHGGSSERPRYHGNGFASLFADEQVLSGEGRLEQGKYEFGFDLVFPDTGLPSSIDFERGTVSYMVTSTLTRPTTIGPTTTCDRKVILVDQLDIGLLPPPRPRTIFLEPISKRTRRKKSMAPDKDKAPAPTTDVADVRSEASSVHPSDGAEDSARTNPSDQRRVPTDTRSEVSGESGQSATTSISREAFSQYSMVGTPLASPSKQQVVDDKTITATIELLRGGCLPGDTVSVRVSVQHIKQVKSMAGVIVTLFRQARIDSSPSPASFTEKVREGGRRSQKDEAYPRSRTKLGGLSLSSTSSTSVFRKDLDQNMAPLITDPATLYSCVTISVKVPDDSFPSMKGVPGGMIGFKYQVEVIVDLGGKLSHQFLRGHSRFGVFGSGGSESSSVTFAPRRGPHIADTTPLRREKGVVSVSLETVIGTLDSSRGRKSRVSPSSRTLGMGESDDDDIIRPELGYPDNTYYGTPLTDSHVSSASYFPTPSSDQRYMTSARAPPAAGQQNWPPRPPYTPPTAPVDPPMPYVPPPQLPDANMSEKDQLRQAEARLLPSQPPGADASSSAEASASAPTAPIMDIEEEGGDDTPRAPYSEDYNPLDAALAQQPSAPTEEDISGSQASQSQRVEDKQEIERRRLMGEASAPPEVPEDMQRRSEDGISRRDMAPGAEPSAPVLNENGDGEDGYNGYGIGAGPSRRPDPRHGEQLPAYER